jgi:hypothetical protein
MRAAGAPLFEIGQVLRHRHVATTALYAKDDLEALGRDSLIWPREGGLKWPRLRGVAGCRCDGLIWPHLCDTP